MRTGKDTRCGRGHSPPRFLSRKRPVHGLRRPEAPGGRAAPVRGCIPGHVVLLSRRGADAPLPVGHAARFGLSHGVPASAAPPERPLRGGLPGDDDPDPGVAERTGLSVVSCLQMGLLVCYDHYHRWSRATNPYMTGWDLPRLPTWCPVGQMNLIGDIGDIGATSSR